MNRVNRSRFVIALVFAVLCLVPGIGNVLYAQRGTMTPKDRAANLKKSLDLTDSQTTVVTQLYTESQEQMKAALDSAKGDRQSMRDLRMSIMKKTDERIDSLLTDDQKKKYEELRKDRQGRARGRQRND